MRLNRFNNYSSYLISILLHVIIFFILSLFTISQSEKVKELALDWITSDEIPVLQEDFTPEGSTGNISEREPGSSGNINGTNSGDNPPAEQRSNLSRTGRSIEPPIVDPNANTSSSLNPGTGSGYLSGVKSRLGSGSSGSSGYQLEDGGGNITVLKSVLPNPPINDYGLVKLQFGIKADGSVKAESIIPVILDDPIYTEASINALKLWKFSVKSQVSSKVYRISFIFKPE